MRLSSLLLLGASLSLVSCTDSGKDGDGDADSDGDGIPDAEEEDLGTDPDSADSDGDGVDDPDEIDAGTDPVLADSDGDGFDDGAELTAGTDALDPFSWEFGSGQWPDFSDEAAAAGIDGTSYDYGEVVPNFKTVDQFGNEVELYQFYGYVVLIDFSAGWCGPCRQAAENAEEMWEAYREDGFMIVHAVIDNNAGNGEVSQEFLEGWAEDYGLQFPVLDGDPDTEPYAETYIGLYRAGLNEGYIPYMIMVDQEMRLVEQYVGAGQESVIEGDVEELLGL